jgi:hypothetical protein
MCEISLKFEFYFRDDALWLIENRKHRVNLISLDCSMYYMFFFPPHTWHISHHPRSSHLSTRVASSLPALLLLLLLLLLLGELGVEDPLHDGGLERRRVQATVRRRNVAVQVAFERKDLKPGEHFIGSRFETRRFQAMGKLNSQPVQPHRRARLLQQQLHRLPVRIRGVAMQVEGDSLLIGRHIHHSAFSLADRYFSQSDEEEVGQ